MNFKKCFGAAAMALIMAVGAVGCSSRQDVLTESLENDQQSIYLNREDASSVYGVETPGALQDLRIGGSDQSASKNAAQDAGEVKAVWISYLTLEPMTKGKTRSQFTQSIGTAFKNAADTGFNTVFVHVRPFADALYDSDYFPWSRYLTGEEGVDPGYDPLKIMCELADDNGLRIEAWINPYRVRLDGKAAMSSDNQARKWVQAGTGDAISWNGGVYYNPGSAKARGLIVKGVEEIVRNYDVDGIHFDDYFYPTTDMAFDASTYKASGTSMSQADWRRENVNILVRDVYSAIKDIDPDCLFGISPQGNMDNNYNGQFADCAKWLSTDGYVDYICPQVYFGYKNKICPYEQTVQAWNNLIKTDSVTLYIGLGAYKLGTVDTWAGEGKNEWVGTNGLLASMVETARDQSNYGGTVVYAYESLFGSNAGTSQVKSELASLKEKFS